MVERDIVLAKVAAIDRCLNRVHEVRGRGDAALTPIDVEDITVLNIQRAAQAAIDLAAHVVSTEGYGIPADVADTFALLAQHAMIDADLADRLRKMVGFRNIAVHNYQSLDPRIIDKIVESRLEDLRTFAAALIERLGIT
jgi:uncharacterized protein YutE (UPF0331/DUF86 family)